MPIPTTEAELPGKGASFIRDSRDFAEGSRLNASTCPSRGTGASRAVWGGIDSRLYLALAAVDQRFDRRAHEVAPRKRAGKG